jgi:hypothetical protein
VSLFRKELANIRNPAYGSLLIHSLAQGYREVTEKRSQISLPIIFLAFPLLLEPDVLAIIRGSRLGLRALADKLSADPRTGTDLLLSMPDRVNASKEFALASILVLLRTKLAHIDLRDASLVVSNEPMPTDDPGLTRDIKQAAKLGGWLAELSIFEISIIMKVAL